MTETEHQATRIENHIIAEGIDIPPPITNFQVSPRLRSRRAVNTERMQDMKIPKPILNYLKNKGIKRPTPIQMQGLPAAFAGRDMIGIAFTGSGKTLTFTLPAVMASLEMEAKLPFVRGEGPVGLIICPSRELARQTYEQSIAICTALKESGEYPEIRNLLCIGGINMGDQADVLNKGVHVVVATPGRLMDLLDKGRLNANNCK